MLTQNLIFWATIFLNPSILQIPFPWFLLSDGASPQHPNCTILPIETEPIWPLQSINIHPLRLNFISAANNTIKTHLISPCRFTLKSTMSDKCGNCDCADSSKCVKKGNQYGFDIIETEHSETMMMETGAENDGKCKCGSSCACVDCHCGAH